MLRKLSILFFFRNGFLAHSSAFELAVGLFIVFAFQHVLTTLISGVVFPMIGALIGGLDFSNSFVGPSRSVTATNLADAKKQGAVLAYGEFLTTLINFIIALFVLSFVLRAGASLAKRSNSEAALPQQPTD
ncbi:MscL family protein [Bradyrhizobium tropiciagri]|uniref:MscL family protein n=1 Tax=Bradyrhizobium tropiciagri TaxID=312253 RepID=UPI001BA96366|nr:MscL family protein [Bradyrhizobium tropiciagri]MBR0896819.1 MscL family protein [Bradyrhizobium tropiciagri]